MTRLIAIEEHCRTAILRTTQIGDGFDDLGDDNPVVAQMLKLDDLGPGRLADMDANGIDIQVLSQPISVTQDTGSDARLATAANDELAAVIAANPQRFAGFATVAMGDPIAAADELERSVRAYGFKGAMVSGTQNGRFLDDPFFWPVFERAAELGVPIYLHPAEPPAAVRAAYYTGLQPGVAQMLATAAWGWHVETGLHALRLIVGGVFDQFPTLQVVLGHMGEALPFMLARTSRNLGHVAQLERTMGDYFRDHFHVTTSGMFADAPLLCLLTVLGADRVIFSVDYPFSENQEARAFIERAPIKPADLEKIGHLNAERLLGL